MMLELDKIYNMDCIEGMKQLDDNSIDCIITDPPYNMGKDFANDNLPKEKYLTWSGKWLNECKRILKPSGNLFIFGVFDTLSYFNVKYLSDLIYKETIIWYKKDGGYTNKHELIFRAIKNYNLELKTFGKYIKKRRLELKLSLKDIGELCNSKYYHRGGFKYFETGFTYPNLEQYKQLKKILNLNNGFDKLIYKINNNTITLSDLDGQGNVWDYLVDFNNKLHPTQKPVKLIERLMDKTSREGDIVLDCFMGSGTTAVACKRLNRRFIGFEIDKEYCEIANKRMYNVPRKLEEFQT